MVRYSWTGMPSSPGERPGGGGRAAHRALLALHHRHRDGLAAKRLSSCLAVPAAVLLDGCQLLLTGRPASRWGTDVSPRVGHGPWRQAPRSGGKGAFGRWPPSHHIGMLGRHGPGAGGCIAWPAASLDWLGNVHADPLHPPPALTGVRLRQGPQLPAMRLRSDGVADTSCAPTKCCRPARRR